MPIFLKVNHQLESRMPEIGQSGSEGGAAPSRPYPYVRLKVRTNNRVKVPIGQEHWSVRSRRQLRRRETGWGAAGSE